MLISHSFLPRSMFNMDSWTRPASIGFGPSTLGLFDPFDELDQMVGRNLNWLTKPTFFNQHLPEKFRVTLDCSGYKSESIKTEIKDGFLIVVGNEGEHKSMRMMIIQLNNLKRLTNYHQMLKQIN